MWLASWLVCGALLNAPPFPRRASRCHATMVGDLQTRFSQLRDSLSTDQQKELDLLQMATDAAAAVAAADLKAAAADLKAKDAEKKAAEEKAKDAVKLATIAEELAIMKGKELQRQTSSLVTQLCKYKCVLENRHLLEQAAEKLYASEECSGTAAQVQKLINNQVLLPRPPLASRAQAAPTPHPVASLA